MCIRDRNKYRVDTTKMFIGGYSAGAITVLHAAYVDQTDVLSPLIWSEIQAQGGLKGNTGDANNRSHDDTDYFGVINFAGSVYDKNIFDAGEPMLMSYHGDIDNTVPIDSNIFFNSTVYGSRVIHHQMDGAGIPNTLEVAEGAGHVEIFTDPRFQPDLASFLIKSIQLYYPRLCGFQAANEKLEVDISSSVSPNPATNAIELSFQTRVDQLLIYDPSGRQLQSYQVNAEQFTLHRGQYPAGIYFAVPVAKGVRYKPLRLMWN